MTRETLPANFGKPWTAEEDTRLRDAFALGVSVETLALRHARTQSSCRLRLEKLGMMQPEADEPVRGRDAP